MKMWVGAALLTLPSYPYISPHLTQSERLYAVAGLAIYALGALIFGKRLLNLNPKVFGHHELFHVCTVVSFVCGVAQLHSLFKDFDTRCNDAKYLESLGAMIFGEGDICTSWKPTIVESS